MVQRARRRATAAAGLALVCITSVASAVPAAAARQPTPAQLMAAVEDYCGEDGCRDILAPGQNGNATLVEILGNRVFGTRPEFSDTQLEPYDDLLHDYGGLTEETLDDYFLDASFGVAPDDVGAAYRPRHDVTIVRDEHHGIPHIYGETREGTMFGAGYAAAENRLFLMDVLRNLGRGRLTSFAGGAESNRALEQSLWRGAPYTEADKQAQIDRIAAGGERGARALADVDGYLKGINAYIDRSQKRRDYPGEYVLAGHKDAITQAGEIEHFTKTDIVGIAAMVGLLFGGGGGGEVQSALTRAAFIDRYGPEEGEEVWRTWRMENDPEATVTASGEFPYTQTPQDPVGRALPEPGSVVDYDIVHDEKGSAADGTTAKPEAAADGAAPKPAEDPETVGELSEKDQRKLKTMAEKGDLGAAEGVLNDGVLPADLFEGEPSMSNALVVSGEHTENGHPVSVSGPQTGYFSPQLLMVQELQGPGISARGASFPGVSFYVQIGRGADYAWSPTSAGQDITDTFAVELCEPDGSAPTVESRHYTDGSECTAFEKLSVENAWKPTVADQTPAGSYTLTALRSKFGLIDKFGLVDGEPVAFATRRSTYQREVDSIIGFQKFNDPDEIRSAQDFQRAAMDIGYAFNWHYNDADDIAYVNSGLNPVRTEGTDANLPILASSAAGWSGWDPVANEADYTPLAEHPNEVNADYFTNWNNKPAAGYTSGYGTGSVHRADLLDGRLKAATADGGRLTRSGLVQIMAESATTDLRGEQVLPELLKVLKSAPVDDPAATDAVAKLTAWQQDGAHRREGEKGAGTYEHAEAIRIMDAWWPRLVEAQFEPGLGADLYARMSATLQIDESPSGSTGGTGGGAPGNPNQGQAHKGSSFQFGWWSYSDKDLRAVLGEEVQGPLGEAYCGGGDLDECRTVLMDSLTAAAALPAEEVYPGDAECEAGDQVCADSIVHSPLGGITMYRVAWQNRPTYQLVHQFSGRR